MKRFGTILFLAGTAMVMIACIAYIASPNVRSALSHYRDGISVIQQGDFTVLGVENNCPKFEHPKDYAIQGHSIDNNSAMWVYLQTDKVVDSESVASTLYQKKLPGTYAMIEASTGGTAFANIEQLNADKGIYGIQIPGRYNNSSTSLRVDVHQEGFKTTSFFLKSFPKSTEEPGELRQEIGSDGIKVSAEAFRLKFEKPLSFGKLGYKLTAEGTNSDHLWRWVDLNGYGASYSPFTYIAKGGFGCDLVKDNKSISEVYPEPFAEGQKTMRIKGSLESYDVVDESVNFGTLPIIHDKSRYNSTDKHSDSYFKTSKEISVKTSLGLRLTLLPLTSSSEHTTTYGDHGFYYRLRAEQTTLNSGLSNVGPDDNIIVEVKLAGGADYFQALRSQGFTPSHFIMQAFDSRNLMQMEAKFLVRRLIRRKYIPIDFKVPIKNPTKEQVEKSKGLNDYLGSATF